MGLLHRGWRGGNSPRFLVEVGTHRPDACVSAVGIAEESDVLRWDFCTVGGEVATSRKLFRLKWGRTARKRACLGCRVG